MASPCGSKCHKLYYQSGYGVFDWAIQMRTALGSRKTAVKHQAVHHTGLLRTAESGACNCNIRFHGNSSWLVTGPLKTPFPRLTDDAGRRPALPLPPPPHDTRLRDQLTDIGRRQVLGHAQQLVLGAPMIYGTPFSFGHEFFGIDPESAAKRQRSIPIRHPQVPLPAGYGLNGNPRSLRHSFLRKSPLFPESLQPFAKIAIGTSCHGAKVPAPPTA